MEQGKDRKRELETSALAVGGEGDGEGTLSHALTQAQEKTSATLREQLDSTIARVKNSKLKLKEKADVLSKMVKAHETLTRTERMTAGLDKKVGGSINAGVIVIPQKEASETWHEAAVREIESAKAPSPAAVEKDG